MWQCADRHVRRYLKQIGCYSLNGQCRDCKCYDHLGNRYDKTDIVIILPDVCQSYRDQSAY